MEIENIEGLAINELRTIECQALEELKKCSVFEGISAKDAPNFSKLIMMHGSAEISNERWQEFCKRVGNRFDEQYRA